MQCDFYETGDEETSQEGGYWDGLVICFPTWIQLYPEIIGSAADPISCLQLGSPPRFRGL